MLLATLALTHLLQSCAPNIGPRTMTAIVHVESGGNPLAVRDNTLNRAFYPKSTDEAVRLATYLLGKHHSLDLGISQLNSANLPGLGMSVREAFEPCSNLRGGASILAGDYRRSVAQFGPGQYALRRAIGAYNTGSLYAGNTYISMILDAAGIKDMPVNVARVPNLAPESQQASTRRVVAAPPREPAQALAQMQQAQASMPMATTASAIVRPEDSPILIRWNKRGAPVIASSGEHMTHIPLNQGQMTHIPLNGQPDQQQNLPQATTDQSMNAAAQAAPIILRTLPMGTAQNTITPQQLLQEAAAMRRQQR